METKEIYSNLSVTGSPHRVAREDTTRTMTCVLIALLPALLVGIYQFGIRAAILTVVTVASCVVFEWLFEIITKRPQTVRDLSAAVTGLILAMNLPASLPYWMAVVGAFVAIVVVKQLFGGLGQNFANPAVTARIVLLVSFSSQMSDWPTARGAGIDAVTSATPLALAASGEDLPSYMDMFLGNTGGCIGETCALALIVGGLFLIFTKVITPFIPLSYLGTVLVIAAVLPGQDPLYHLLAGGLMIGAFFCATDYVTSPFTPAGQIVFGIGCGLLTMLIRVYGTYPEGVSFAILLMNILTPHIDNVCVSRIEKKAAKA